MNDPSETQSLALVGEFLRKWSHMEQTIHLAISCATNLDPLMNTIICANLTIREKLNVLRTIVDVSDLTGEDQAQFKSMLRDIGEYTPNRNMIAHDWFLPLSDHCAVGFMPIKAKGRFATPTIIWDKDDFDLEYRKIEAFTEQLLQLTVRLEHASFNVDKLDLPMRIVGSSARERRQSRQTQGHLGSDPTSRGKGDGK
jgi:hypothetical protein